jgi:3-hexulose-6-phosphate synthase
MAELQLTLDHGKRHELIRMADLMADHIDILEIGYPELITFGLDLVQEIHEAHPDLKICADAKVFHGGSGVTRRCFESGASLVTVLAYAPNQVIQQMVRHANEYGGAIMCDLDGVRNLGRRTAEVDKLGVRYCHVSTGYLMEHEYDLMKPTHGSIFQLRPLERAAAVKRNLIHASLALGTGINEGNLDEVLKYQPKIVMVGRGIYAADGAYKTSPERQTEIADRMRARLNAQG